MLFSFPASSVLLPDLGLEKACLYTLLDSSFDVIATALNVHTADVNIFPWTSYIQKDRLFSRNKSIDRSQGTECPLVCTMIGLLQKELHSL